MPLETRLVTGLLLASVVVYIATPVAIRLAGRWDFYDKPIGYKGHARPTPYLGGAAVTAGFLVALVVLTTDWDRTLPVAAGVVALWAIGTTDDRRTLPWWLRVAAELVLAAMLWALDLGWDLGAGPVLDLATTLIWVVAVVNALNLFDNMDGQASTMGAVIAAAVAVLGLADSQMWLAVAGGALAGACLGFLPHNLSSPAKIFLGDGGSMPIGFALAALVMIGAGDATAEWQALAVGLMLVGVPAIDTALVMISRRRRGISILTGGRDHLTHRTRERVRTARAVAMALGGGQAVLATLALVSYRGGSGLLLCAVFAYVVAAGSLIALLDAPSEPRTQGEAEGAVIVGGAPSGRRPPWEALVLVPLALGMVLSPFWEGFYESSIWAPAGLVLMVLLVGALIARPPTLDLPAILVLTALVAYGVWAAASASWADSAQQAMVEGNRWLVYAVLLGLLVALVRSGRSAMWLLGAVGAGSAAVVMFEVIRLAVGGESELFLGGRLNEPLEYINGLADFHLLALFPAVALAERRSRPWLAGLGMALVALLVPLLLMSQSRGVAIAAGVAGVVVLAVIPGRLRRAYVVLGVAGVVALLAGDISDLYDSGAAGSFDEGLQQDTARMSLVLAIAAGLLWGLATWAVERMRAGGGDGMRTLRRTSAGALAAVVAVAGVVGLVKFGDLTDQIDRQYDAFVHLGPAGGGEATGSRLVSGAGNRYDYWRVASRAWRGDKLVGVGAGNYDARYFLERETDEDIRQPHSLPLQTLAELGLVGGLLLAAMFGGVAWAISRTRRAASEADRFLAVGAVGIVTAWTAHTSVDWIHLLPGVTAIALAAVAVLLRPREGEQEEAAPAVVVPRARLVAVPLVAVALLLSGVSLSRQALSEFYARDAAEQLADNPGQALKRANQALRLQPEAIRVRYTKAAALARFGDAAGARAALEEARRREPDDFVTYALLGDLAVRMGNLRLARANYREALERNPRDPSLPGLVRDPRSALRGAGE